MRKEFGNTLLGQGEKCRRQKRNRYNVGNLQARKQSNQSGTTRRPNSLNGNTKVAPTCSRAPHTTDLGQNEGEDAAYGTTSDTKPSGFRYKSNCRETCRKVPFLGTVPASPWVGRPCGGGPPVLSGETKQNCSDGGPDIDFRAPRRNHAHFSRQMFPRGARQKEIVRDVTEKRSIRVSRIKKPAEFTTILSRPS